VQAEREEPVGDGLELVETDRLRALDLATHGEHVEARGLAPRRVGVQRAGRLLLDPALVERAREDGRVAGHALARGVGLQLRVDHGHGLVHLAGRLQRLQAQRASGGELALVARELALGRFEELEHVGAAVDALDEVEVGERDARAEREVAELVLRPEVERLPGRLVQRRLRLAQELFRAFRGGRTVGALALLVLLAREARERVARAVQALLVARVAGGNALVDLDRFRELLLGLELLALDDRGHRGVGVLRIALREARHHLARSVAVEGGALLGLQLEIAVGGAPQALGRVLAVAVAIGHGAPHDHGLVPPVALREQGSEQEARLRAEVGGAGAAARLAQRLLAQLDRARHVAAARGSLREHEGVGRAQRRRGRGADELASALAGRTARIEVDHLLRGGLQALLVTRLAAGLGLAPEDREPAQRVRRLGDRREEVARRRDHARVVALLGEHQHLLQHGRRDDVGRLGRQEEEAAPGALVRFAQLDRVVQRDDGLVGVPHVAVAQPLVDVALVAQELIGVLELDVRQDLHRRLEARVLEVLVLLQLRRVVVGAREVVGREHRAALEVEVGIVAILLVDLLGQRLAIGLQRLDRAQ
jgi:hypothetical protein